MAAVSSPAPAPAPHLASLALLVNLQSASSAGFAPVGLDAERYGEWLLGSQPVPEVVAHHAAHHPGVATVSEITPPVDPTGLDVPAIIDLARTLGAGELVAIATDPDGGSWPVAEQLLDAARAANLQTGLAVDVSRDPSTLLAALEPDTVRSIGGDSAATTWPPTYTSGALVLETFRSLPVRSPDAPWELRAGIGPSLGWNRAETADDLRSPRQLIDLFARAIAAGGRLLLDIPVRPDGSPSPIHLTSLHAAAPWFARHAASLSGFARFDVDGDATVRYLAKPGPEAGQRTVAIVDLTASPNRSIAHFSPHRYPILSVIGARSWLQDASGVHLEGLDDDGLPSLVLLTVTDRRLVRLTVQGRRAPGQVTIAAVAFPSISAALAAAAPGDVVQVGPGRYGSDLETFPLHVPAGVALRGPEPPDVPREVRKHVPVPPTAEVSGLGSLIEVTGSDVELAHLHLVREGGSDAPLVHSAGVRGLTFEHCTVIGGNVTFEDVHASAVRWSTVEGGELVLCETTAVRVTGGRISGTPAGQAAVTITRSLDVRVEAVAVTDSETAVAIAHSSDAVIGACALLATHTAVRLDDCSDVAVSGNRLRAMRAVHVRGSHAVQVRANGIERADTAMLIEGDPSDVAIDGNHIASARQALLVVDPTGS